MQFKVEYVVVVLSIFLLFAQESFGAFLEDPINTTCILGTPFMIHCRTPAGAVSSRWVYNESRVLITHPPEGLTPRSFNDMFMMELTCTRKRHYTTIQCVAILSINPNREEPSALATIKVQGMPDRVTNLHNTSYPSVIKLTWSVLEPNITYCVTVEIYSPHELINETCGLHEVNFSWIRDDGKYTNTEDTWYRFRVAASNSVGRGPPSHPLETNFFFSGLPDIVKNVSHVPMECATLITWNSSGPNVTYCIQIFNSTTLELVQDEVCELKEPYFLFNTTCPDTENTYEVKVTAVTDVGSGLPSNLVEVVVLPATTMNLDTEELTSSTSTTGTKVLSQESTSLMRTIIIVLLSSVSAIVLLVLSGGLLFTIYKCYRFVHNHKETLVTTIDMLRCDAYESRGVHQLDDISFEKGSTKDVNHHYESIMNITGAEPNYAHIT